jgi:hypothetical protein
VSGIITRHDIYESRENWDMELEREKEERAKERAAAAGGGVRK